MGIQSPYSQPESKFVVFLLMIYLQNISPPKMLKKHDFHSLINQEETKYIVKGLLVSRIHSQSIKKQLNKLLYVHLSFLGKLSYLRREDKI